MLEGCEVCPSWPTEKETGSGRAVSTNYAVIRAMFALRYCCSASFLKEHDIRVFMQ